MADKTDVLQEPRVEIDREECKACYLCVHHCPKQVIEASEDINRKGFHPAHYKGSGCTGCGICFYACPEPSAITVYRKIAAKE
jgi:Pyruvate/2-oxoacid:ferredoxin oxidoreductase delta subunit